MLRNRLALAVFAVGLCAMLALGVQAQTISTIAGGGPPNGIKATTATIGLPWSIVQDAAGNSYISDNFSNRIFKVDTKGIFTVIAGNGVNNESGDGGPAILATLSGPEGLALDTSNNADTAGALYIADTGNNMIRVVNTNSSGNITLFKSTGAQLVVAAGDIAVVAGTGTSCSTPPSCGDGGSASAAQLNAPGGVAINPKTGDILIADTGDSVIRDVSAATGDIEVSVGDYTVCSGSCGDGGSPTSAELNQPNGVFVDAAGDIFIADTGDEAIRVVNNSGGGSILGVAIANGKIGRVAGTLLSACSAAPACGDGAAATFAHLSGPSGLFYDGSTLWIADSGNQVVRSVGPSPSNTISLVAGSYTSCNAAPCGDKGIAIGNPNNPGGLLSSPSGVFVTGGNVFVADQQDDAIREVVAATGDITTVAGVIFNESYYSTTVIPATSAQLNTPDGVGVDSAGDVFIADTRNDVIRKVDTTGKISTVAGDGTNCTVLPCGNGAAAALAQVTNPQGTFIDASGNIYIADSFRNVIRFVNTQKQDITFNTASTPIPISQGNIDTVVASFGAGCATAPCGDGGLATDATLLHPSAIFVTNGIIYISDTDDEVIRAVNTNAVKVTVAGISINPGDIKLIAGDYTACPQPGGNSATCGDGGAATSAKLNTPEGIFVDSSGNIFFADNVDNAIRKIDGTTGTITKIAGDYTSCSVPGCGNGGAAASAEFVNPFGVWLDFTGNIFVADAGLSAVRAINMQKTAITLGASGADPGTTINPGDIDRVVGNGIPGFSGDGGAPDLAQLNHPHALAGDAEGDLFITDTGAQRVRKVTKLMATAPNATLSVANLSFGDQAVGVTSSSKTLTVTNNGVLTALTVNKSGVALGGTNAKDFSIDSDTCSSAIGTTTIKAGSSCTVIVSFTPTATGTRKATVTLTDNAGGGSQSVILTGTAVETFTLAAGALSATSVNAGGSATATITVALGQGFVGSVALSCSVDTTATPPPTCSLNPDSVTAAKPTSTLTVDTTANSAAMVSPALGGRTSPFYAMWLLLPAVVLSTAGLATPSRRKLLSWFLVTLAIAGCLYLVACGGGGNGGGGGGGGGGTGGTPSGTYSIKVTGTASGTPGATSSSVTVKLTVN